MCSSGGRFQELDVYQVLAAFKRMRAILKDGYAEVGLAAGQEHLLAALWQEDGLSQRELVRRLGVEQPTVAKAVRRLEASGFVRREPDSADRRITRVLLTDRGRVARGPVERLWRTADREFGRGLLAEEKQRLGELLRRSFGRA
jgi:DNA-binding MarR family transcriptional regulator